MVKKIVKKKLLKKSDCVFCGRGPSGKTKESKVKKIMKFLKMATKKSSKKKKYYYKKKVKRG
ncbi:Uncharacterised protein [uncultured archaeon]|nr:Uncharacterised protein [uncultured archaeon]